jgi:hypothetical protein
MTISSKIVDTKKCDAVDHGAARTKSPDAFSNREENPAPWKSIQN